MRIVELILDEDQEIGIEAISVVENPAIEEDFIALKSQEFKLAEVDKERRILMGALLIPNKPIYRRNGEDEYYIYFSKDTVLKASQMYLTQGKQNNSTLEHQYAIEGLSLVESWLVEDKVHDKSVKYGMDLPLGTWVGSVKVNNDKIWNEFVKTGKVKGFSIEGYFADKMERPKEAVQEDLSKEDKLLNKIKEIFKDDLTVRLRYPENSASGLRRVIDNFSQFLSLVSISAMLIAGIGIANTLLSFINQSNMSIAVKKALGFFSLNIKTIYYLQLLILLTFVSITSYALSFLLVPVADVYLSEGLGLNIKPIFSLTNFIRIYLVGALVLIIFSIPTINAIDQVKASNLLSLIHI